MREKTSQFSIKYRPKTWEEIFGHQFVVKSLKERIIKNNYPKAVLLEGSFGVGKSSIAQIFAAAMQEHLPDGNPNWEAPACKSILEETFDRDTQRLDGSQIGGKMDIVDFLSDMKIKPMYDRKRIYIIEEADQLSKAALNALLKVMEDPTAGVHFILLSMAEKEGISPAIKSRCQVFKLKKLDIATTMMALKSIMEKEGLWSDESIPDNFKLEGLKVLAESSEGSLRTAVQNLEACLVGKIFDPKEVAATFASVDFTSSFNILVKLLDKSKDEDLWNTIASKDTMHLYNYMTMLLVEAVLLKETGWAYDENEAKGLKVLAKSPNLESLYYSLTLHPQMNKPFMRSTDLLGALVSYYQNVDFRPRKKIGVEEDSLQNFGLKHLTESPKIAVRQLSADIPF